MVSLFTPRVSWFSLALGTIAMAALPTGRGEAALITFTRLADFETAASLRNTNLETFESYPVGGNVSNVPGLTFGAIPNGNLLQVTDGTPTFGALGLKAFGTKYLGSDAGELISLGAGQSFTISFKSNMSAIGFFFIKETKAAEVKEKKQKTSVADLFVWEPLTNSISQKQKIIAIYAE